MKVKHKCLAEQKKSQSVFNTPEPTQILNLPTVCKEVGL